MNHVHGRRSQRSSRGCCCGGEGRRRGTAAVVRDQQSARQFQLNVEIIVVVTEHSAFPQDKLAGERRMAGCRKPHRWPSHRNETAGSDMLGAATAQQGSTRVAFWLPGPNGAHFICLRHVAADEAGQQSKN